MARLNSAVLKVEVGSADALPPGELLSAACDGEITPAQMDALLAGLRTDVPDARGDSQRRTWNTHHLIGDALRMGDPPLLSKAFHARMSAALEREPTVLSPGTVASRGFSSKPLQASPFRKPLWLGFSVAASVAAVAFVGYGAVNVWRNNEAVTPQLAKAVPSPAQSVSVPAVASAVRADSSVLAVSAPAVPNEYLVAHRQLSGGLALQGYTQAAFPVSASVSAAGQK